MQEQGFAFDGSGKYANMKAELFPA